MGVEDPGCPDPGVEGECDCGASTDPQVAFRFRQGAPGGPWGEVSDFVGSVAGPSYLAIVGQLSQLPGTRGLSGYVWPVTSGSGYFAHGSGKRGGLLRSGRWQVRPAGGLALSWDSAGSSRPPAGSAWRAGGVRCERLLLRRVRGLHFGRGFSAVVGPVGTAASRGPAGGRMPRGRQPEPPDRPPPHFACPLIHVRESSVTPSAVSGAARLLPDRVGQLDAFGAGALGLGVDGAALGGGDADGLQDRDGV